MFSKDIVCLRNIRIYTLHKGDDDDDDDDDVLSLLRCTASGSVLVPVGYILGSVTVGHSASTLP